MTAFTEGMNQAGVATAVKHFPGLGRVRGNTDFMTRVVDRATTRHDAALAGFSAAIDADVDMVMVSSALYRKIDDEHRAAFSTKIIDEMLRKDLGFSRIVISMIWRLPLCELSRPMSAPSASFGPEVTC